jgi:hypothetical protein
VGPRAVLDAVVKRKIRILLRESDPRTPIIQPVILHRNGTKHPSKDAIVDNFNFSNSVEFILTALFYLS